MSESAPQEPTTIQQYEELARIKAVRDIDIGQRINVAPPSNEPVDTSPHPFFGRTFGIEAPVRPESPIEAQD